MTTTLLTAAVLVLVGLSLARAARMLASRSDLRRRTVEIVSGVRPRHVLLAVPAFAAVIAVAVALLQIPGLDFGWWTALGGTGNPVTGGTDQTAGTALEWVIPALFLTMLIPALPLFAEREEVKFRLGAETWSKGKRLRRAVEFGLIHAVIGIPIGVALALSVGGLYFTWAYLRAWRATGSRGAALLESTRAHFAYNATLIGLVAVAVALGW